MIGFARWQTTLVLLPALGSWTTVVHGHQALHGLNSTKKVVALRQQEQKRAKAYGTYLSGSRPDDPVVGVNSTNVLGFYDGSMHCVQRVIGTPGRSVLNWFFFGTSFYLYFPSVLVDLLGDGGNHSQHASQLRW